MLPLPRKADICYLFILLANSRANNLGTEFSFHKSLVNDLSPPNNFGLLRPLYYFSAYDKG